MTKNEREQCPQSRQERYRSIHSTALEAQAGCHVYRFFSKQHFESVLTPSHKSYHPYNEKNKQRVREDEARAQAEEEREQQIAIEAVRSA